MRFPFGFRRRQATAGPPPRHRTVASDIAIVASEPVARALERELIGRGIAVRAFSRVEGIERALDQSVPACLVLVESEAGPDVRRLLGALEAKGLSTDMLTLWSGPGAAPAQTVALADADADAIVAALRERGARADGLDPRH